MKFLAVHPSALMYTRIFLRLEPLGLELVAAAARRAGHDVRLIDLQVETARTISPTAGELAAGRGLLLGQLSGQRARDRRSRQRPPRRCCPTASSSSAATARPSSRAICCAHAEGAIDCVLKGEGEASVAALLEAVARRRGVGDGAGRGHARRAKARRRASSRASTICARRATCCAIGANTSSARSIPAPRSSSRAAAPGTAPSAAPGPSTAAATARRARRRVAEELRDPRAGRLHRRRRRLHP